MSIFTDLTVRCRNPKALDETVQQLGPAAVIEGSWNGDTCKVRIFGNPGFVRFAIVHQGYGEVLDDPWIPSLSQPESQVTGMNRIPNKTAGETNEN